MNNNVIEAFVFPLSFAQQRLWFLDQLEPGTSVYNIPLAIRLAGPLNVAALQHSLNEIVRRHEALRTTFAMVESQPVQIIASALAVVLPVVDLRRLSDVKQEIETRRLATEEAHRPFDLAEGPLLRVTLLWLGEQEYVLLLTMHHIVSDGWSMGVFNQELAVLYKAFSVGKPSLLPELPIQYADFAHWQRQWLQGEVLEAQLAYWTQQLGGGLPVLKLPNDRPRPAIQTFRGSIQSFMLSATLTESLNALSHQEGVTLFMTLLAAFKTLLYRYTGQEDILVGSPIANRNRVEIEELIGFFVNTLVLRTDLSGNPTFREMLGRVRVGTLEAYAHQDLPFEKLVEELQPERDLSHNPLFQVMFALQNAPEEALLLPGLTVSSLELDSRTARFDLTLSIKEIEQELKGIVEYSTDLLNVATIRRMIGHFQTLLEGTVANPKRRISDLSLLMEAESQQLLVEWNDTKADYPQGRCIHHLFEAQVEQIPDAVVAVFEERQLSCAELNRRANQLAHYLRTLGVGPEVLVGICVERSLEMVVGLLGILKAGGAYVPLDPTYPKERLAFMLEDAQVPVLLIQGQLEESLSKHGARVVCLDTDWEIIARESEENLESRVMADNPAYTIYTSGSTGRPKGVAITHRSTVALLHWAKEVFSTEHIAGVLASTSICFDLSIFELFVPLSWGGRVILAENVLQLPDLPAVEGITLINTVPSAMMELLRMESLPASTRIVNLAGEPLQTRLVQQLYEQGSIRQVFDLYGPSEDTTYSTFTLRSAGGPDTIGRPVANTRIYLLDANLQPVPVGVPGELHIGGMGLARGYLSRPGLTAEKFIPEPFGDESGTRLYKTGDLARYLPDGNIEFLGRIDHQVKIRGYRIELGEIEAMLGEHPAVQESVAMAREDTPGDRRLVAYIVPNQEQTPTTSDLRNFLKERLPGYMVPVAFVFLETLPLTPSGKVERQALPAPEAVRAEREQIFVAPRAPSEKVLAGIWAQVLGLEQVGIHDNFFELGGDSILSMQVIAKLKLAGLQATPKQFVQHQTIAELATVIGKAQVHTEHNAGQGSIPFTPSQYRFFQRDPPRPQYYNIPIIIEAREALQPDLVEKAVQELIAHHDALRLCFVRKETGWQQFVAETGNATHFAYVDLSRLPVTEHKTIVKATATTLEDRQNLSEGRLLQVALFDYGLHKPSHLVIIVHHLVCDGVSLQILLEDLQTIYRQLRCGEAFQLSKTTSFRYWANRLVEYARSAELRQEFDYWCSLPWSRVTHIPVDYSEGANTIESTRVVATSLSVEETSALLREVPKADVQANEALLVALYQTFALCMGMPALLLYVYSHGRAAIFDDVDLSRTTGWFTSRFPLLLSAEGASDLGEVLDTVKRQVRQVPNEGVGYNVLYYLSGDAEIVEQFQAFPQAEIAFNYRGQFDHDFSETATFRSIRNLPWNTASPQDYRRYLLWVDGGIVRGQLQIEWSYSAHIHRQSTIETLAARFIETMRSIIAYCDINRTVSSAPGLLD